jgi:hypothetical protein
MNRKALSLCFACVFALPCITKTEAHPKNDVNRQPQKGKEIYVIVKAQLFEVEDAFYKKLAKTGWRSKEELEELERQFLNPPKEKQPQAKSLFVDLEKQKLLLAGKEVNIDPNQEGLLLALGKPINCLPSPAQLRQGQQGPQVIHEGLSLRAQVQISADRRFVRAKFMEEWRELEGTEKVNVVLDEKGMEAVGEIAFLKEGKSSQVRDIPDGGSFLLPLHYRPRTMRESDRWLVALIVPRIYIEEEERLIRGQVPK